MSGTRAKLSIVVALILAFGALQCANACTADVCKTTAVPPCHKHHTAYTNHGCDLVFVQPSATTFLSVDAGVDMNQPHSGASVDFILAMEMTSRTLNSPPGSAAPTLEILRL